MKPKRVHTCKAQEVHWEESEVEENHRTPEMHFAAELVSHVAGPFWTPVIETSKHSKEGTSNQDVMEVGNNVVGILYADINWGNCQNQACESTHRKYEDEAN